MQPVIAEYLEGLRTRSLQMLTETWAVIGLKRNAIVLLREGNTREITGISKGAIRDRIAHGWSVQDALTVPLLNKNRLRDKHGRYRNS